MSRLNLHGTNWIQIRKPLVTLFLPAHGPTHSHAILHSPIHYASASTSRSVPLPTRFPRPFGILSSTVPSSPVTRDVSARGLRTRIAELGDGPPLLLLHGLLASRHAFDSIIEPLARDFRVVAVDLPGFGDSEKPPPTRFPYSLESSAEVVADVIAALSLGRCHLIGHAMGASVGLTLAAEHPEFVDRLVLVAPHLQPDSLPRTFRLLRSPLVGSILFKQLFGRASFRSLFAKHMYAPGHDVPPDRVDSYFNAFNSPAARESAYAVMRAMADTRASIARLSRLKSRTLVVWGRSDAYLTPQGAQRIVRQIASAQLEFLDSGHSPHEEQPALFVETVDRFFRDQRR